MHGRWTVFALLLLFASSLAIADIDETRVAPSYETWTGCLERTAAGDFVQRGAAEPITLLHAGGMDKHIGRTVKVNGRWQDDPHGRRLRVAKIEYVAEGCQRAS
jgi:hypothetical protein